MRNSTYTLKAVRARLTSITGNGVLSATSMGRGPGRPAAGIVRLRDLGRIELGAQNYGLGCTFDGQPAVGLAIFQLPGSNAVQSVIAIRLLAGISKCIRRCRRHVITRSSEDEIIRPLP